MNNKIKIEIPKDLSNDIQNLGNEVAKQIAIMSREGLSECYMNAIESFYSSYDPSSYVRKEYKNKLALYNTYKKYYTNAHGNIFYGGIIISPDYIPELHEDLNYEVLDLALHGWHGNPKEKIYTTPTPWDLIIEYREYILNNIESWGEIAISKAKKTRNYIMLFK